MSGLLELREITRTFTVPDSEPLQILTGVNLSVSPGEHVAIVGRSGTGKSTLLNILGLIDKPTSGNYTLSGTDTSRLGESRRAHLRGQTFGFVFQSSHVLGDEAVSTNAALGLRIQRVRHVGLPQQALHDGEGVPPGERLARVRGGVLHGGLLRVASTGPDVGPGAGRCLAASRPGDRRGRPRAMPQRSQRRACVGRSIAPDIAWAIARATSSRRNSSM